MRIYRQLEIILSRAAGAATSARRWAHGSLCWTTAVCPLRCDRHTASKRFVSLIPYGDPERWAVLTVPG